MDVKKLNVYHANINVQYQLKKIGSDITMR